MRVTNKGARAFFIWTLLAFIVMLCVIGWSMAEAFNLSPYTFKLRSKTTAADSLYIKGDTLYADQMAVSLAAVLKAVAVQTDTVRGSSSIVGVLDSAIRIDPDSSSAVVVITFGGYGGGLRWDRSTDAMQYTNDFSTWTDIGTGGSSTTNADSLDGAVAHVRPLTDGYYLRYAATGDSLYLAAVTGSTDEDSIFVAHKSSRWMPLPDSSGQYMGATTDSTMLWYNLTDDNIISYVKVFYNEDVTDSALVTWGSMMAQIAATGSGDITGVITSAPLTGGAASGDVSLGFDWTWLYGFNDTMTARVPYASAADSIWTASNALITANNGAIYLLAPSPVNGGLFVQIGGNAQLTIDTGTVMFNRRIRVGVDTVQDLTGTGLAVSGYALTATLGTAITSSEITDDEILWQDLDSADAKIAIRDVVHDSLNANWSTFITTDTATLHLASKANIKDSIHTARTIGSIWTLSADWVNTANPWADNEVANNLTVDDAGIASTITRDTEAQQLIRDSLFANSNGFLKAVNFKDSLGTGRVTSEIVLNQSLTVADIDTTASNWVFDDAYRGTQTVAESLLITLNGARILIRDSIFNNSNNFFKTAGNGLTSTTSTVNVVAGANGLTVNADSIYIDTTKTARFEELRANWLIPWPDSVLGLGSGAGLIIGSSVTLGTDITDDTLVVDYYPEYTYAVLADLIIPTWKDSIDIYGYIDTVAGMDNTIYFNNATVTSGLHRRGFQLTIKHPMRVDSLRYIIVQGLVKDSSATNTMWLKGMLRTSTFRAANVDSNAASTIKDYDSLGGDYADVASVRQFVLSGGAITEGSPWYLLLIARHGSGTAWNWAQSGRIRAVYSRTKL